MQYLPDHSGNTVLCGDLLLSGVTDLIFSYGGFGSDLIRAGAASHLFHACSREKYLGCGVLVSWKPVLVWTPARRVECLLVMQALVLRWLDKCSRSDHKKTQAVKIKWERAE